jgi:hypothetical protein
MKTTVEIADPVFEDLKRFSAKSGKTMKEVLETAIRVFLKSSSKKSTPFSLKRHVFRGEGLSEGVSEGDWSAIREKIYEGRGG